MIPAPLRSFPGVDRGQAGQVFGLLLLYLRRPALPPSPQKPNAVPGSNDQTAQHGEARVGDGQAIFQPVQHPAEPLRLVVRVEYGTALRTSRRKGPLRDRRPSRTLVLPGYPWYRVERATGIEPASLVWKTRALPLSYARVCSTSRLYRRHRNQIQLRASRVQPVVSRVVVLAFFEDDRRARGVAQLGSASALGAEGRRFKSCHPDCNTNHTRT